MRYPVFIHQMSDKRFVAMCPLIRGFYVEADSVELALGMIKEKFICFLHDKNTELEIISIDLSRKLKKGIEVQKGL